MIYDEFGRLNIVQIFSKKVQFFARNRISF
jgi:hypothetical protein